MVPLMMPSTSCDADTDTSGITLPESDVVPHFNCLDLGKAMVALMMLLVLCYAGANGVT